MNDRTEVQEMVHQINIDDVQERLAKVAYDRRMEALIAEYGADDHAVKKAELKDRVREILA